MKDQLVQSSEPEKVDTSPPPEPKPPSQTQKNGGDLLLKTVTFGKHKGTLWGEVPKDYLQWLAKQDGKHSPTARDVLDLMADSTKSEVEQAFDDDLDLGEEIPF